VEIESALGSRRFNDMDLACMGDVDMAFNALVILINTSNGAKKYKQRNWTQESVPAYYKLLEAFEGFRGLSRAFATTSKISI